MTTPRPQDALHELADALSEDILDTPGTELLGEVAEDAGHPDALVAEFDALFASALQRCGHEETDDVTQAAPRLLAEPPESLLGRLRTWWQNNLTMFPGLTFPNRFAMTGLCSAFLVIVAVTVAIKNPELMSNPRNSPPGDGQVLEEPGPPPTASVGKNPAAQPDPTPLEQARPTPLEPAMPAAAAPAPRSLESPNPVTPPPQFAIPATPGRRVALVVGNQNYAALRRLATPANDALAITATLRGLGFEVSLGVDLKREQMEDMEIRFARDARNATTALVFYAGHGLQYQGENFLIPIDARIEDETDLRRLIRLQDLTADIQNAAKARILIIDASRDNGLSGSRLVARSTRSASAGRGLGRESGGIGTMVVYADQPDRVAPEGAGPNSPFTAALLRNLAAPGVELRTVMSRVRADVVETTGGRQLPFISDSMSGDFVFEGAP